MPDYQRAALVSLARTVANTLEHKHHLPLSWTRTATERHWDAEFIALPSKRSFIYDATVSESLSHPAALAAHLRNKFPEGFLVRGVDWQLAEEITAAGGEALCLGAAADLNLQQQNSLASRPTEGLVFHECAPLESHGFIAALRRRSPHHRKAALRFLFQTSPSSASRVFVARELRSGSPQALISLSPASGSAYSLELMLRATQATSGTMEHLIIRTAELLASEGSASLSLGEVPFVGDGASTPSSVRLRGMQKLALLASRRLARSYDARALYSFKNKFSPRWRPVYWCGWPRLSVLDFLAVALHSNTLDLCCERSALRSFPAALRRFPAFQDFRNTSASR